MLNLSCNAAFSIQRNPTKRWEPLVRSTVPLKLAVPLNLGRNFVDPRLPRKRSNPLPLQLRGQLSPGFLNPPKAAPKLREKPPTHLFKLWLLYRFLDVFAGEIGNKMLDACSLKSHAEIRVHTRKKHTNTPTSHADFLDQSFSGFPPRFVLLRFLCFGSLRLKAL